MFKNKLIKTNKQQITTDKAATSGAISILKLIYS